MGPLLSCPLGARPQSACPDRKLNSLHELPRHQIGTPSSAAELPKGDHVGGFWVPRCWPEAEGHAFEGSYSQASALCLSDSSLVGVCNWPKARPSQLTPHPQFHYQGQEPDCDYLAPSVGVIAVFPSQVLPSGQSDLTLLIGK